MKGVAAPILSADKVAEAVDEAATGLAVVPAVHRRAGEVEILHLGRAPHLIHDRIFALRRATVSAAAPARVKGREELTLLRSICGRMVLSNMDVSIRKPVQRMTMSKPSNGSGSPAKKAERRQRHCGHNVHNMRRLGVVC